MATVTSPKATSREKRELAKKQAALKRKEETLARERAQLEREKRQLKSANASTRQNDKKVVQLRKQIQTLKTKLEERNAILRQVRVEKQTLAKQLKKSRPNNNDNTPTADNTELLEIRNSLHALLDSLRLRKQYYSRQIVKVKKRERTWEEEQREAFHGMKLITKLVFPDQIQKITLSREKPNRVVLTTVDGDVVVSPVQVDFVADALDAMNVDKPSEILGDMDRKLEAVNRARKRKKIKAQRDEYDEAKESEKQNESGDDSMNGEEGKEDELSDDDLRAELEQEISDPAYIVTVTGVEADVDTVYGPSNDALVDSDIEEKEADDIENDQNWQFVYHVGDQVLLKDQAGIIRYIGPTVRSHGDTVYGIELIDGSLGRHNGTVGGITYFECPDVRGLFVREEAIRRKMRPRDRNLVDARNADRFRNAIRRQSSGSNLNIAVLDESITAKVQLDKCKAKLDVVLTETSNRVDDLIVLETFIRDLDDREMDKAGLRSALLKLMSDTADRQAFFSTQWHEQKMTTISENGDDAKDSEDEQTDLNEYEEIFLSLVSLLNRLLTDDGKEFEPADETVLSFCLEEIQTRTNDLMNLSEILFFSRETENEQKDSLMSDLIGLISSRHDSRMRQLNEMCRTEKTFEFEKENEKWLAELLRWRENVLQLDLLMQNFGKMLTNWPNFLNTNGESV